MKCILHSGKFQTETLPGDELRMAAWRDFDGSLLMEKPPANPAIALTLAMMRGQSMHFE